MAQPRRYRITNESQAIIRFLAANSACGAPPPANQPWDEYHSRLLTFLMGGTTKRDKQRLLNWLTGTGYTTPQDSHRIRIALKRDFDAFRERAFERHKELGVTRERRQSESPFNPRWAKYAERPSDEAFRVAMEKFLSAKFKAESGTNFQESIDWQEVMYTAWGEMALGQDHFVRWPAY